MHCHSHRVGSVQWGADLSFGSLCVAASSLQMGKEGHISTWFVSHPVLLSGRCACAFLRHLACGLSVLGSNAPLENP